MAGYVQIVEFQTTRIDELRTIADEMDPASSEDAPLRRTLTADRNRPNRYFTILEFDSYEAAMKASASPETSQFARRMAELCDTPPTFFDLTVLDTWSSDSSRVSKTARKLAAQAKAKKIATQAKTLAAGAATAAVGVVVAAKAARKQSDNASAGDNVVDIPEYAPAPVTETVSTTADGEPSRVDTSTEPPLDYPDDLGRPL